MIADFRYKGWCQIQEILELLNMVSNRRTGADLWQPQGERFGFKIMNKFLIGIPGYEISFLGRC